MNGADASDHCPRCGGGFTCGRDGATRCPCTGVALDAATLAGLRRQYSGCLCLDCLRTLVQDDTKVDPSHDDPGNAGEPQGSSLDM